MSEIEPSDGRDPIKGCKSVTTAERKSSRRHEWNKTEPAKTQKPSVLCDIANDMYVANDCDDNKLTDNDNKTIIMSKLADDKLMIAGAVKVKTNTFGRQQLRPQSQRHDTSDNEDLVKNNGQMEMDVAVGKKRNRRRRNGLSSSDGFPQLLNELQQQCSRDDTGSTGNIVVSGGRIANRLKYPNYYYPKRTNWIVSSLILLWTLVLLYNSLIISLAGFDNDADSVIFADAKTHQSKRQAAMQSAVMQADTNIERDIGASNSISGKMSGRENNNWWNLWWQQYINEAVQPTVRPIVSISFNGRQIGLSPDQAAELSQSIGGSSAGKSGDLSDDNDAGNNASNNDNVDVDATNSVGGSSNINLMNDGGDDIERRSEKLIQLRVPVPGRANNRPTVLFATGPASRPVSTNKQRNVVNRQATMYQVSDGDEQQQQQQQLAMDGVDDFGIQMRASVARQRGGSAAANESASRRRTMAPALSMGGRDYEQQPLAANSLEDAYKFEQQVQQVQQQTQMTDYGEPPEVAGEMDGLDDSIGGEQAVGSGSGGGGERTGGSRPPVIDSSSSSMMQPLQPALPMRTPTQMQTQTPEPRETSTQSPPSMRKAPDGTTMGSTKKQQTTASPATSAMTTTASPEMSASSAATSAAPGAQTGGQTQSPEQVIETQTQTESPPSTPAPTMATTPMMTKFRQSTTPSGGNRVELMNGRPATSLGGFNRFQGTTTSSRLPTTSQSTTTMSPADTTPATMMKTKTTSGEDSMGRRMRPGAGPSVATTTSQVPTTSVTTTTRTPVESQTTASQVTGGEREMVEGGGGQSITSMDADRTMAPTAPPQATPTTQVTSSGQVSSTAAPTSTTSGTTTTSAPVGAAGPNATTEATAGEDADEGDDADDGEEEGTGPMDMANKAGNATSSDDSSESESESDSDSDPDSDTDNEQEVSASSTAKPPVATTTTATTMSSRDQAAGTMMMSTPAGGSTPVGSKVGGGEQMGSSPAQLMDIERLPKAGRGSMASAPMTGATDADSTRNRTDKLPTASTSGADDMQIEREFERLRQPMTSGSIPMGMGLETSRGTLESETAITVPMDVLIRMMMVGQRAQEPSMSTAPIEVMLPEVATTTTTAAPQTKSPPTSTSPSIGSATTTSMTTTSPAAISTTLATTTTASPRLPKLDSSGRVVIDDRDRAKEGAGSSKEDQKSSALKDSDTGGSTSATGPTGEPGDSMTTTTMPTKSVSGQQQSTTTLMPTTQTQSMITSQPQRKKLQPPPATQAPSRQVTSSRPSANGSGGAEQTTTMSTDMMIDDVGGEPKVEMINMDLVPIQRLMTSSMMQRPTTPSISTTGGSSGASVSQQQPRQPEQTMTTISMPRQQQQPTVTVGGITRGPSDSQLQQRVPEVEPGMRLRPPVIMGIGDSQVRGGGATMQQTTTAGTSRGMPTGMTTKTGTGAASSTKSPAGITTTAEQMSSGRPSAPAMMNPPSTVYMIMMNTPSDSSSTPLIMTNGQQTKPTAIQFSDRMPQPTAFSKKPIMDTTPRKQELQPQQSLTEKQDSQVPQLSSSSPGVGSSSMRPTGTTMSMRRAEKVSAAGGSTATSKMPPMPTTFPSATATTSQLTTPRSQQPQRPRTDKQQQQQQQQTSDRSTAMMGGFTGSSMTMTSKPMRQSSTLAELATTLASSTTTTTTTTTTRRPTGQPLTDITTTLTTPVGQSSTSGATATGTMVQAGGQQVSTSTTTARASTTVAPVSGRPSEGTQVQQQQQRQKQPPTKSAGKVNVGKTAKGGSSNITTSFIPARLRSDFSKQPGRGTPSQASSIESNSRKQDVVPSDNNKLIPSDKKLAQLKTAANNASEIATVMNQTNGSATGAIRRQQQPPTTIESILTTTPSGIASSTPTTTLAPGVQRMVIRQFGGANRMSALANQPVPFGRPAAIMSTSDRRNGTKLVVEAPTFEYGPSIAVKRPDEPLANGQMPNCTLTGKNFCVLTKDYPMNEVRQAVERSFRSVRIMYEELQTVSDQELHKADFNTTNNQAASGRFACQTQVEMMRPGWAKDEITKEWMLVVNTDVFPQRVRTESCAQPNTPCEFIAPFYDSTCQQRYSLHRMIAIDPHDPSRSPQVAIFKFPAGCVCRVHPIRKQSN